MTDAPTDRSPNTAERSRWVFFGSAALALGAGLVLLPHVGCGGSSDGAIVYGRRAGSDLTLDVFPPKQPNGAGVLIIQSGGWASRRSPAATARAASGWLLERGFTVVLVGHASTPSCTVPKIADDVRRATRFVRYHATEFGIDPGRMGVYGVSSGGHLALLLATAGGDEDPASSDPVERCSCRVAVAVAICPPTDLRAWVTDPPDRLRQHPVLLRRLAIGPEAAADVSPVLRVTAQTAPTLLVHGDCDDLVPIDHSRTMATALDRAGARHRLVEVRGGQHALDPSVCARESLAWFDELLIPSPGR